MSDNTNPVSINEVRFNHMILIKAWPDTLGDVKKNLEKFMGVLAPDVGQLVRAEGLICACLSPGHYTVISNEHNFEEMKNNFQTDLAAVTDISHARCGVHLSGENINPLLNKGLAIDLESLPVSSVLQSSIHSISVILLKLDDDEYLTLTYTSFSKSFNDWVIDSAKEYGYALNDGPKVLF